MEFTINDQYNDQINLIKILSIHNATLEIVIFQPLIRIRVPAIKLSVDKVHFTIFESFKLLLFRP